MPHSFYRASSSYAAENAFDGSLPSELGRLQLEFIDACQCRLPASFQPLHIGHACLIFLSLSFTASNLLSGTFPIQLATLPDLEDIYIQKNDLTGDLNAEFCNGNSGKYSHFVADCAGSTPEISCSCCTLCCDAQGENCGESSDSSVSAPIVSPSFAPEAVAERITRFQEKLRDVFGDIVSDVSTPQGMAVTWLAGGDPAGLDVDATSFTELAERYVLALVYFATNGPTWEQQYLFLSSSSVCDWNGGEEGVFCDQNGNIVELILCKSYCT